MKDQDTTQRTLNLTLSKKPFDVMVTGEKFNEFRKPSRWIRSRLEGKYYSHIKFVNGYGADKPYFICEYKNYSVSGITTTEQYSNGLKVLVEPGDFVIGCGRIIETGNLKEKDDDATKKSLRENIENCLGIATDEELQFHPTRKWAFDVALTEHKIALEIEGGAFSRGRHTRGKGFIQDMEKYNEALRHGWRVIRLTPQQVNSNYIIDLISDLIWKE